jgi:tight adherence protein B
MLVTSLVTAFVVIFALAALAGSAAWNVGEQKRRELVDRRLRTPTLPIQEGEPDLLKRTVTSNVQFFARLLDRLAFTRTMQQHLAQARLKWSVGLLSALMLVCGVLALNLLIRIPLLPWYLVLPGVAVAGSLPYSYVLRRRRQRFARFEEQFPEALDFLARAMLAGHAFSIALEMLADEAAEPLGGEFRQTSDEHRLGLPLDIALQNLARRVPLLDVRFFVSSVLLQSRTGGNLSEILTKLGYVIRERFKLKGQVRALSAHGRLTGKVLVIVPPVVVALMLLINREYMVMLIKFPLGRHLIGAAIIMQVVAYFVIRRIINIRV